MIEEKTRLVQLLDDYIGERRTDGRDRLRTSRARPAAFQPGGVDLFRRPRHGAVGVIGPTRMRYSRAINAVDSLSKAISRMVRLSHGLEFRFYGSPVLPDRRRDSNEPRSRATQNQHITELLEPTVRDLPWTTNSSRHTSDPATTARSAAPRVAAWRAAAPARRLLRSAAAQDRRVRQLPQAHRARAPDGHRSGRGEHARRAAAARGRLRARAQGRAGGEGAEAYRKGVELIHRQLSEILRKRGVRADRGARRRLRSELPPGGRARAGRGPARGRSDRGVPARLHAGDRLLRPAMVKVAKG